MKKKWLYPAVITLGVIILLAIGSRIIPGINSILGRNSAAAEPEFVLLYAENQAEDYPTTMGAKYFSELVSERTGGRIRILVKCDAQLGSEMEVLEQMKYGGIAFARVSLSQLAEFVPEMNVLQVPYLYKDSDHMWRVLDGEIGDDFMAKTVDQNLVGLSWYDAGARNFYTTSPVTCLEDLRGMTIRVQESDMMADMVSALGATPAKIVYSEVYSALEQGLVDGAENNWPSYESMKHYYVAGYYTIDEHTRVPELQLCSGEVWEKLGDEDRQIISECARESALYERELWQEREKTSRQIAEKSGITVTTLTPSEKARFRDAMSPVYEKYCGNQMDLIRKIEEYN